ncbi:MAG: Spy/CpxP family protein refolding chaperone [Myxococcales bacterium]|nr:Spy/CpxP family protein refolding chaperone [Myxococcales bacterium]
MKMPSLRSSLTTLAFPLFVLASGCSAGASTSAPPVGATQQPIATQEAGPLRAVGLALGDVPLGADQRTRIQDLFKQAETRHQAVRTETANLKKDLMLSLADQVERGAIDKAALAPKVETAMNAFKKVRGEDMAALAELHKTLTPDQRKAFVDAFEPKMMHKAMEGHPMKERLGKWRELELTSDQKDKLKEAFKAQVGGEHPMKAFREHRGHAKRALESFKNDTFNANEVMPDRTAEWLPRMLKFVETATPILTPEQRTKAAAMLRERAKSDGPGVH